MKLVQFWKDKTPALGLQTPQGIIDVQAEAARRGVSAPGDMAQATLWELRREWIEVCDG